MEEEVGVARKEKFLHQTSLACQIWLGKDGDKNCLLLIHNTNQKAASPLGIK